MIISDLEKRIREAFRKERAAVDTDELWDSIQSGLPPTKNKSALFNWKVLIPFFLIFVSAGGYFILHDATPNQLNEDLSNEYSVLNDGQDLKNEVASKLPDNDDQAEHGNDAITHTLDKDEVLSSSNLEQKERSSKVAKERINTIEKESVASSKSSYKTLSKSIRSTSKEASSFSYSSVHNSGQNVNTTGKAEQTEWSALKAYSDESSAAPLSLYQPGNSSSNNNYSQNALTTQTDKDIVNNSNYSSEDKSLNESANSILGTQQLWTASIEEFLLQSPTLGLPGMDGKKPFWIEKERNFFIEIGGSLIMGHGSLKALSADWTDHLSHRAAAETSLPSFSFDLRLGYEMNDAISVNTGVILNQYFKRSEATISTIENITIQDGLVQEIIGMNSTQEIRGQVEGIRQTSSTVNRIIKYSFIQIPIGLTYSHNVGAFDLRISGEARLGLKSSYSGYIHPSDELEYDLNADSEGWYKESAPHMVAGGIGISYPISDIIELTLDANYQYQLGNINTTIYGITENLSGIGLRTGIKIKI